MMSGLGYVLVFLAFLLWSYHPNNEPI